MDIDEILPKGATDPLAGLVRQDLDPLSLDELAARIAVLEAEIVRCRKKLEHAVNHRATAHDLFKS